MGGDTINGLDTDFNLTSLCIYAIILAVVLFIIFIFYIFFFRAYGLKKGKTHRCNYCGQMVEVMSSCCNVPVKEHFLLSVCTKCGKDTKMVCVRCRKNITGQ